MKLGIDAHKFASARPTGTERYSTEVIEALIRARSPEDEITLYTSRPLDPPWAAGVRVREIRHLPPIHPFTYVGLPRELRAHPVDLLFVPAHELPLRPPRSVVTIHDVAFRKYPEAYGPLSRWRLEWSTRRALAEAWRIVAISEATKRDLVDLYAADPAKIRVIHPGFTPSAFRPDTRKTGETLRRLRLEHGRYFFYVGRIESKKNLERLIKAFNAGRKSGEISWRLVLAGAPGAGSERIEGEVRRLRLESEVIRPGYITEELKQILLHAAGAQVVPSLYEGFGFPVLEAFEAGVPVLASTGGSLPEVAGDAALLVPPIDTASFKTGMIRLEHGEDFRAELIKKGRVRMVEFSWDKAGAALWQLFKEKP